MPRRELCYELLTAVGFQAKSDAQLAEDKAWLAAEKIWLVHKGGFAAGKLQRKKAGRSAGAAATSGDAVASDDASTACKVKLDVNDTVLDVDEDDVEKVHCGTDVHKGLYLCMSLLRKLLNTFLMLMNTLKYVGACV